jgi:hypothetical protein
MQPLAIVLGLACGIFVWAILCARARRKRKPVNEGPRLYTIEGCSLCRHCNGVKVCKTFPAAHGHVWCRCGK